MGDGFGNLYDPEEGEPLRDLLGLHQSQKTTQELKALREAQERDKAAERAKPQCPYCGGRLPGVFEICTHCNNRLSWVGNRPCKPGTESQMQATIKTEQRNRAIAAEKAASEAKDKRFRRVIVFCVWLVSALVIPLFFPGTREHNLPYFTKLILSAFCPAAVIALVTYAVLWVIAVRKEYIQQR